MRFSYRRVAFFEDFGRWKIRCYFGAVLGESWGRFSELFGRHVTNFRARKRHWKKKAFEDTPETNDKWLGEGRPRVDRGSTEGKLRYMDFRGPARGGI